MKSGYGDLPAEAARRPLAGGSASASASAALAASRFSPRSASRESSTVTPPPSTAAAIGVGTLVRRRAVVAASITARPRRHGRREGHRGALPRLVRVGDDHEDLQSGLVQEPAAGVRREQDGRARGRARGEAGQGHSGAPYDCSRSHLHDCTSGRPTPNDRHTGRSARQARPARGRRRDSPRPSGRARRLNPLSERSGTIPTGARRRLRPSGVRRPRSRRSGPSPGRS